MREARGRQGQWKGGGVKPMKWRGRKRPFHGGLFLKITNHKITIYKFTNLQIYKNAIKLNINQVYLIY